MFFAWEAIFGACLLAALILIMRRMVNGLEKRVCRKFRLELDALRERIARAEVYAMRATGKEESSKTLISQGVHYEGKK